MSKNRKKQKDKPKPIAINTPDLFGYQDDDEFWDMLNEDCDELDRKCVGFLTGMAAEFAAKNDDGRDAILLKNPENGLFFVKTTPEICDGYIYGDEFEDIRVFEDQDKAREYFDSIPFGIPRPMTVVKEIKAEIRDPKLYLDIKSSVQDYYFNVKYDWLLLIEKMFDTDPDVIRKEIKRYTDLCEKLKTDNVSITEMYKERPWNSNTRYYVFTLNCPYAEKTFRVPIPSKMQHQKNRLPLDFFKEDWVDELKEEAQKAETEYLAERKLQDEEDSMYQEPEEAVPPFSYEKAMELFDALGKQIHFKDLNVSGCDGTLNKTRKWLRDNADPDVYYQALKFLKRHGGFCDCEVLMNASDKNVWEQKD